MRFALFYHSLVSDWNHGNAHFLRGVATELQDRGHEVCVYEPEDGWSLRNLVADQGKAAPHGFQKVYPNLNSSPYRGESLDLDRELEDVDVVIVHEWNDPELVTRIGRHRNSDGGYTLLFHDTHHRSATAPEEMSRYDLRFFDGTLVYGEVIRKIYVDRDWCENVWTWHEAADTRIFWPLNRSYNSDDGECGGNGLAESRRKRDLVWIGNWGDGERSEELTHYLIEPVRQLNISARVHGVRYPREGLDALAEAGIEFAGWLPNYGVPRAFSEAGATIHIPRRPYRELLSGIPTIRVFEALACGIPLICLNWEDREGLFTPGEDYLVVDTPRQMRDALGAVLSDLDLARRMAVNGLKTIRDRHTCAHRVDELLAILGEIRGNAPPVKPSLAATGTLVGE